MIYIFGGIEEEKAWKWLHSEGFFSLVGFFCLPLNGGFCFLRLGVGIDFHGYTDGSQPDPANGDFDFLAHEILKDRPCGLFKATSSLGFSAPYFAGVAIFVQSNCHGIRIMETSSQLKQKIMTFPLISIGGIKYDQRMPKQTKIRTKVPEKAKKRAAQVNMMQRSSDEMGKFDNTSATSVPMAITALIGLGFEIALYLFLLFFLLSDSTKIIHDYFYERGWVPYLLTYLASWSFAILYFKRKKLKNQENVMQFKLLPEDISVDIREDNMAQFYSHIKRLGFDQRESFLLTRIFRGLEHFSVRKNHTETADMLKSQSEIDATMVDSSYVLIKVFIWAIPSWDS